MRFAITLLFVVILASNPAIAYYGARYEPPDGTIIHGCGWDGYNSQAYYNSMFPSTHHPLVLQAYFSIPGTRTSTVARCIQSMTLSIVHPDSQYIELGVHFTDATNSYLDSVFALTTSLDRYIDTLARAFQQVNRPFFLRIGFEFNGVWNPYHPYIYPLAFRKLVTQLRARGINNFASVWCYEPDAPADFADSSAQGWKWYPGDDVVDWFGLDPFDMDHFNPTLPDSFRGDLTKKGRTERFLQFAEQRRKPVYLNELSARNVFIVPDSLDQNHTQGRSDWEYWFVPFFQFVRNHPNIKGWNYINLDWTHYSTYLTWGDARLEINSYIRERWIDSLQTPRFLNAGYDLTRQVSVREQRDVVPSSFNFSIYPNPFNATTTINYSLPFSSDVRLTLFDISGREVFHQTSLTQTSGEHRLTIDGQQFVAGMYFLRIQAGHFSATKKLVLLK